MPLTELSSVYMLWRLSFAYCCTTGEEALQSALTSGEWYINNNQSTEQLGLAQRASTTVPGAHSTSAGGGQSMDTDSQDLLPIDSSSRIPKLVPIKSFQNGLVNLSVRSHFVHGCMDLCVE